MYKLLTGHLPFPNMNLVAFMNWCTVSKADLALFGDKEKRKIADIVGVQERATAAGNYPEQYMRFLAALKTLKSDYSVSSACIDIILRFLDVVEDRRLGYGPFGIKDVKGHKFLKGIQWELLEQRHIIPPYKPIARSSASRPVHPSLDAVLVASNKQDWLTEHPSRAEQKNFKNWNYISPYIVKVEMGMEMIMEQYDDPFKNKHLLVTSPVRTDSAHSSPYFNFRRPSVNNNNNSGGGSSSVMAALSPVGMMNSFRRLSNPNVSASQSRRPSSSSIGTASVTVEQPSRGPASLRERRSSVGSASGANSNGRRPSVGSVGTLNTGRRPSIGSASVASNGRRGSNVSIMSDGSEGGGLAGLQAANNPTRRSSFSKHQQIMRQLSDDVHSPA